MFKECIACKRRVMVSGVYYGCDNPACDIEKGFPLKEVNTKTTSKPKKYDVPPTTPGMTYNGTAVTSTHYQGTIQPIEFMQATMSPEAFQGFLRGNCIKYISRAGKKEGNSAEQDIRKVIQYATWLEQALKGEVIDPRK